LVDPLAAQIEGKEPDDFVFSAPGGGVMRNSNFYRQPERQSRRNRTLTLGRAGVRRVASGAPPVPIFDRLFSNPRHGALEQIQRLKIGPPVPNVFPTAQVPERLS
jgi:hypothetical protein